MALQSYWTCILQWITFWDIGANLTFLKRLELNTCCSEHYPRFCTACPQNRRSRCHCWNERIRGRGSRRGFDAQWRGLPICPHHSAGGSGAPKEGMMPDLGWGRCSSSRHRPRERLLVPGRLMRTEVLTEGPGLELDSFVCVCVCDFLWLLFPSERPSTAPS